MFAKHSFGVKYLFEIRLHPVGVTPQEHTLIMTAALIATAPPATPTATRRAAARPVGPEVYRRRRLVVVAAVVGLLLGLASFGQADATPTAEARSAAAVLIVVQPGDTLWTIADSLVDGTDLRPLVAELAEIAGGATLQPGQLLRVPGDLVG